MAIKEEDTFEKTANELEEVLKKRFPETSQKSSANKPILTVKTSATTQIVNPNETIKTEAGMNHEFSGHTQCNVFF